MTFTQRAARHFLTIKAAREIKKEIEKAGLDNLKVLAERGVSIVGTYLQGCSPKEKEEHRRSFNALLAMGVTPEMVLEEVGTLLPEVGVIMKAKGAYKRAELQKIAEFLKGEEGRLAKLFDETL